jgi:uncharacterized membrane protein
MMLIIIIILQSNTYITYIGGFLKERDTIIHVKPTNNTSFFLKDNTNP